MKFENGVLELTYPIRSQSYYYSYGAVTFIRYTDAKGNKVDIPVELVKHLHDSIEFEEKRIAEQGNKWSYGIPVAKLVGET